MSARMDTTREYWLELALHSALGPAPERESKSWLSSLRDAFRKTTPFASLFDGISDKKVIIAGLDGAGKRTLLRNFISLDATRKGKDIETRIPYIGVAVQRVCYPSGVTFHAFDVGGCSPASYRKLEQAICGSGDAIVWVIDASDRDRIAEVREEIGRCIFARDKAGKDGAGEVLKERRAPVLILVNKSDLDNSIAAGDISGFFGDKHDHMNILETDSLSGNGVFQAFSWLGDQVRTESPAHIGGSSEDVPKKY